MTVGEKIGLQPGKRRRKRKKYKNNRMESFIFS